MIMRYNDCQSMVVVDNKEFINDSTRLHTSTQVAH